jgi:hypothetical protein
MSDKIVFGYTAEQLLQVAADYLGDRLDDCANAEERDELLEDYFPTGQARNPVEVARAVLEDRDEESRVNNDGRVTVDQFKAWCE